MSWNDGKMASLKVSFFCANRVMIWGWVVVYKRFVGSDVVASVNDEGHSYINKVVTCFHVL